jgi:hypothetical protein
MGLLGIGDTAYALRFLRLLTMPWEKTAAYKEGIIDKDGEKIKDPETSTEKNSYTLFHKLVFNIRRLLAKIPLGKSTIARYATALWLIREKFEIDESSIEEVLSESLDFVPQCILVEETDFVEPGVYKLKVDAIFPLTCETLKTIGDTIQVIEQAGEIWNIPIYKAIHEKTNQTLFVTGMEIEYG